jgi:hypothetical protein
MFRRDNKLVLIGAGVLMGAWIGVTGVVVALGKDWTIRGQIGDTFGVANSLFSGLALTFAAYALVLQARELEAQRQERERESRVARLTAQPRLVGVGAAFNEQRNDVTVENIGASASNITVRSPRNIDVKLPNQVAQEASIKVTVRSSSGEPLGDVVFTLEYTDSHGERGTQRYFLPKNSHFLSLLE